MQTVAITSGPRKSPPQINRCSTAVFLASVGRGTVSKVDILIPLTPPVDSKGPLRTPGSSRTFQSCHSSTFCMKMQGWRDHRASRRSDFRAKVGADVTDVCALLVRARWERISYRKEYRHHTRGFMSRARRLALGFVGACGGQRKVQELGFPM
jgi:hypothetical protein